MTGGRGRRRSLAVAVVVPAVAAGAIMFAVAGQGERRAPLQVAGGDAERLARDAEVGPPLRPIVLRGSRATLGTGPAGALSGRRGTAVPVRMAIPELHVNARIEPVSATGRGIEVPQIGRAGWFDAGPRPGDPGRAVIIGHIDGPGERGVFHHVPAIRKGAEIVVVDADGRVHRYETTGKLQVPKDDFPAEAVYGASDRPVLVLVTCGGTYEPGRGYSDNVLVYARATG